MANQPKTFLGHPLGLYVLFFTELWERFSFYGMKTLLLLYMLKHFFWTQEKASDHLGWYAALAYGVPVIGGFIADRYIGAKRAVIYGAILLTAGHFLMAFEPLWCFYGALGLIIAGVGFLKPNISTQVGNLYKPDDHRRDGAFTIFYMGINLGALAGPLLCDWLRVNYGYHAGFGAAGVGMVAGLIVYVLGHRVLVEFNQEADEETPSSESAAIEPSRREHPPHVVRDRVIVLLVVFAFVILFWTAFEQSPNAMLVWADQHTNLRPLSAELDPITLGPPVEADASDNRPWYDFSFTSGQTQSFNPFFIITLAPIFALLWAWLDRRGLQPSTPTKMVLGLAFVAIAFAVMWPAAERENSPCQAKLAALPQTLGVDDKGRVFTSESEGQSEPTYYGATRLHYDSSSGTLMMNGVLTDLDRFRILAHTAPHAFVQQVEEFAKETANQTSRDDWQLTAVLASAPDGISTEPVMEGEGSSRKKVLEWDPNTKTLTALGEIKERTRIEFLARAAQPDFKEAIDQLYLESAKFRVSVWWLIAFFMVLTMGELCLSPVGLSLVTKLAPAKHVGLFMGGWFLATAVAEKLAQVFGAWWGKMPPSKYFAIFVVMCGAGALLMAVLIRPLTRRMHGVQ